MNALSSRAAREIRYIRDAMEKASAFTAVPGAGGVAMGTIALAAAAVASRARSSEAWLAVWLATAAIAVAVGAIAMSRKAQRFGTPLLTGPARRFLLTLTPPLAAGGVLTFALARAGRADLLPGVWLLLYGTAVVTAGAMSVRPVLAMGALFMALGAAALASPSAWGTAYLAAGFGGLQILFGIVIWRRHGG